MKGKINESYDKLKNHCKIILGQSPKSEFYNENGEGVPFLQGNTRFGDYYPKDYRWCTKPKKTCKKGDLLISVRASVGEMNFADKDYCIGRGLAALRTEESLNTKYLYFILTLYKNNLLKKGTGSTFKAIRKKDLENFKIPIIPINKQNQLVNKIDNLYNNLDLIKEMHNETTQMCDNLMFKIINNLFSNISIDKKIKLEDIVDLRNGKFLPKKKHKDDGKYPVYGANGKIGYYNDYYINNVTLSIGRVGACGEINKINSKSWITDNAIYIFDYDKERILLDYLYYLLINLNLGKYANKSSQPSINQQVIKNRNIKLPSLSFQEKIVKRLKNIDISLKEIENNQMLRQKKLENLHKSILKYILE